MKTFFAAIFFLAWATIAQANTLTWTDNSATEGGFSIEMLTKGTWTEVARDCSDV